MTSIKIKFRKSTIKGKKGSYFIQVIHRRKMETIATGMRVEQREWNAAKERIITSSINMYTRAFNKYNS